MKVVIDEEFSIIRETNEYSFYGLFHNSTYSNISFGYTEEKTFEKQQLC